MVGCLVIIRKRFHWTYNKIIDELPEIREAALLCQCVRVVSILVHHTVSLQSPRTLKENGGQLLQAVLSSKVEQSGKLLIALIWRTISNNKKLFTWRYVDCFYSLRLHCDRSSRHCRREWRMCFHLWSRNTPATTEDLAPTLGDYLGNAQCLKWTGTHRYTVPTHILPPGVMGLFTAYRDLSQARTTLSCPLYIRDS